MMVALMRWWQCRWRRVDRLKMCFDNISHLWVLYLFNLSNNPLR